MGIDPNSPDNRWLREVMQQQIPVIYFLGTSPSRYQPIIPTFIVGWHPERLRVQLAFGAIVGASAQALPPDAPERRYALREVKARLHQASFRDAVLAAYGGRCVISHLPEPRLLDAAHIIMDADEQLGQPIVSNGLPLTKIHHAAFDAHLIGIDPHYRIHVSDAARIPRWPASRTRAERDRRAGEFARSWRSLFSDHRTRLFGYRGRTAMEVTSEAPLHHSRWGISC
jgi:putative restriction endonuclease